MKIYVRPNPINCRELSAYLGYPVNSWTRYPDGGHLVDLGVNSLTPVQRAAVVKKLAELPIRLVEDTTPADIDVL